MFSRRPVHEWKIYSLSIRRGTASKAGSAWSGPVTIRFLSFSGVQKLIAGRAQAALADCRDADESDDKHRAISPALLVGMLFTQLGDQAGAVP